MNAEKEYCQSCKHLESFPDCEELCPQAQGATVNLGRKKTPKEWEKYWIKQKLIRIKRLDNEIYHCNCCDERPSVFLFKINNVKSNLGFNFFYLCESCSIILHAVLHNAFNNPKKGAKKNDK